MNISMWYTWPAFCAKQKTVTRRNWKPQTMDRLKLDFEHTAWDRNPRFKGVCIGGIYVTETPFIQNTSEMTDQDYIDEGFWFMDSIGWRPPMLIKSGFRSWWVYFNEWRYAVCEDLVVVRFEPRPNAAADKKLEDLHA
ncbi:hypothetical protein [Nitrospina gracilis]|uniref:hypothetical protein n=1 Tax=Nitrospina gracilis TaxID=35801 RepID=UPI001F30B683|nr:hypothetical protein [Nitrospina gracilis]MCF8719234.1 hypothetical protein [Nitrospina gracilis Nb-211]